MVSSAPENAPSDPFGVVNPQFLGAVEISTFISMVLFGILLAQGYTYFQRSAHDRLRLRILVSAILLLEACHTFTAGHMIYYDSITKWRAPEPNSVPLSASVVVETIITVLVQCFFAYRIFRLSGKFPISIACLTLALLRFGAGFALSIECFKDVHATPNGTFVFRFSWLITSGLAVGGGADLLIALSMSYYLRKFASPTNMRSTTEVINRLIRFSLQTGLITSMTSMTVIICFQTMKNMVWFGIYVIIAKIYSNSLLVSLNARPNQSSVTTELQFESVPPIPLNRLSGHAPNA